MELVNNEHVSEDGEREESDHGLTGSQDVSDGEQESEEEPARHEYASDEESGEWGRLAVMMHDQRIQDREEELEKEREPDLRTTLLRRRIKFYRCMERFENEHPGNHPLSADMKERYRQAQIQLMAAITQEEATAQSESIAGVNDTEQRPAQQTNTSNDQEQEAMQQTILTAGTAGQKNHTKHSRVEDMSKEEQRHRASTTTSIIQEPGFQGLVKIIKDPYVDEETRKHIAEHAFDLKVRFIFFLAITIVCAKPFGCSADILIQVVSAHFTNSITCIHPQMYISMQLCHMPSSISRNPADGSYVHIYISYTASYVMLTLI
jgi:hypothetical protein